MTKPILIGLTEARLKELLYYDAATGVFLWRRADPSFKRLPWSVAGRKNEKGYLIIDVDIKPYRAHRLAWLYMYGAWPTDQLDHRNGTRDDNRISNLRDATNKENHENFALSRGNTSGYRGVSWDKNRQKFMAKVMHHGKTINVGRFDTADEAGAAAAAKRAELFTHDEGRDRIAA